MKTKTTIKNVKNLWSNIYYCGYCDLYYIMYGTEATYYNAGIYGWNCDIYTDIITDTAITTGYRNMTGKRIPEEIVEKFTNQAKKILENQFAKPYKEIQNALDENRKAFFNELCNS